MAGRTSNGNSRELDQTQTPTWAVVAVVNAVIFIISTAWFWLKALHKFGEWFSERKKQELFEWLEKVKAGAEHLLKFLLWVTETLRKPKTSEEQPAETWRVLLYNQQNHISEGIRQGEKFGCLKCIPTNPNTTIWGLTTTQKKYVKQMGLHHLAKISHMVIDQALITALVERWRPETNSFHFPSGEATITLEDVAYIYGLPIDGAQVTGRTFSRRLVPSVCQELLGITPQKKVDYVGMALKFKWLEDNFKAEELEKKKNMKKYNDYEIQATRAYLFFLVSGQIISQTSGAQGPVYLLELFKDFKPYAWAPACLANLYRMLANATWWNKEKTGVGEEGDNAHGEEEGQQLRTPTGPLQLLQLWAYTRMSIGRCPKPTDSWNNDIQFPLFKTWQKRLEKHSTLTTVKEVRNQLNNLNAEGFNWRPYHGYGKKFVKNVRKVDRALFSSSTVLVFYWIVERHNTWRVMKQFGFKQLVPPPFNMPIVKREWTWYVVIDYSTQVDEEVEILWAARAQIVLHGEKCELKAHSEEYLTWYGENSLKFIERSDEREHTKASQAKETAKLAEPTIPQKHVEDLVAGLERSCDRAECRKVSIEKLTTSIRKKLTKFKGAFGTTFDDFSMDGCSSSYSD